MSLLFNMLSRMVTTFFQGASIFYFCGYSHHLVVILEPKKIKSLTVPIVFPFIYHEVMGLDAMIFIFRMLSFKSAFSPSSFTFIKRLFSSSLLSAIRVVSSVYLRWLILLLAILIPACISSSLAFCMIYRSFLHSSVGRESTSNAGDTSSIPE